MEEAFDIDVVHKGKEFHFHARFLKYGYSYRIVVEVNGHEVIFEPDEERNFRARMEPHSGESKPQIDLELVKLIGEELEQNLK